MLDSFGLSYESNKIRIIDITPVQVLDSIWLCVGFEELSQSRGDNLHLAFLYHADISVIDQVDLLDTLLRAFRGQALPIRIHSECLLGDVFGTQECDCGQQLRHALSFVHEKGMGIVFYLRQEGRGIGLRLKLSALALQDGFISGKQTGQPYTNDEANLAIGRDVDERTYEVVAQFLQVIGVESVQLLSGNLDKRSGLETSGIQVEQMIDMPRLKFESSRQYRELQEKMKRSYIYPGLATTPPPEE